ncbi:hypothetical protein C7S16_5809 [Burkholderia thailandensis]|uniref:Uncharacterized protein n=1 Tax=Burkholderia thailandensis TaxID=57975 RepID=A0AAW9CTF4_BURTH|nr:hypothetical protein [Burkholderia thailandensis]MDW9251929.1 hypothetical protein [Burkholderia thailandensis]
MRWNFSKITNSHVCRGKRGASRSEAPIGAPMRLRLEGNGISSRESTR